MRSEITFRLSPGDLRVHERRREREWLYLNGARPSQERRAAPLVPLSFLTRVARPVLSALFPQGATAFQRQASDQSRKTQSGGSAARGPSVGS